MSKNCRLILTTSYFGAISILQAELENKKFGIDGKNLVFCEDKVSLMAERAICDSCGTFNTDVYSFGKFLHLKTNPEKTLTKEGASMAVKKILVTAPLERFAKSRVNLAPALYDLIIQLKSASVTPEEIYKGIDGAEGLLKHKLQDIYTVFSAYEQFLLDGGYTDQSARLATLPAVILSDKEIEGADVYLLGYRSWTKQAKQVVFSLLKKAKSVTAILTAGDNQGVYLNETAEIFRAECKRAGVNLVESKIDGGFSLEGGILSKNLFNPISLKDSEKYKTDKIALSVSPSKTAEINSVAYKIKKLVMETGCRYSDITVAIAQNDEYKTAIKKAFDKFEIPYFLDERKAPKNHPLVRLVLSYIEVIRKNFEKDALLNFIKNPLVNNDKAFTDGFENYVIKYNVNYTGFTKDLLLGDENERQAYNEFLSSIVKLFVKLDIRGMLKSLNVKEKLDNITRELKEKGERTLSAINDRMYDAVISVIDQMEMLLGGVKISASEIKQVFTSGISAMELSIIPQNADAVFVGGYKEVALAKAKYLFATGLDASMPACASDVALLSDGDISALEDLKLLIEPKIQIVNDRERECTALAVCSFSDKLFMSYTANSAGGKSEIITYAEELFSIKTESDEFTYLTTKQGLNAISEKIGKTEGKLDEKSTAFYLASSDEVKQKIDLLLSKKSSGKTPKIYLSTGESLLKESTVINKDGEVEKVITISPSMLEKYHDCPYKAFLSYVIRLNERQSGELKVNDTGTFIHAVLEKYTKELKNQRLGEKVEIKIVDRITSDAVVDSIVTEILKDDKFSGIAEDEAGESSIDRIIAESKKHAYIVFMQDARSEFHPDQVEFKLNDKNTVKFLDGKVTLKGTVDRIDTYKDQTGKEYFRIIDYKTGTIDDSVAGLYSGNKLQLYLYASAFPEKELAGAYYYKLEDKFVKEGNEEKGNLLGVTLSDENVITKQDSAVYLEDGDLLKVKISNGEVKVEQALDKDTLSAYKEYAVKISEKAIENLNKGVIVASPCNLGNHSACQYCQFKGLCLDSAPVRQFGKVQREEIINAVEKTTQENSDADKE